MRRHAAAHAGVRFKIWPSRDWQAPRTQSRVPPQSYRAAFSPHVRKPAISVSRRRAGSSIADKRSRPTRHRARSGCGRHGGEISPVVSPILRTRTRPSASFIRRSRKPWALGAGAVARIASVSAANCLESSPVVATPVAPPPVSLRVGPCRRRGSRARSDRRRRVRRPRPCAAGSRRYGGGFVAGVGGCDLRRKVLDRGDLILL